MSFENIIVANIGWSEDYLGGQISSAMEYVQEVGTGAEAYNFAPSRDGLFYGYIRAAHRLAERSDRLWTIVFISKPSANEHLRIVGWYEDAVVAGYRSRPEYGFDPDFPNLTDDEQYMFSAVAAKAYVLPEEHRADFILPRPHRIGATGLYFAAGEDVAGDNADQRTSRRVMAEWLRRKLPPMRSLARRERPDIVEPEIVPGIIVDDGGHGIGFSPVAESAEHRALRLWACENPSVFTGEPGPIGRTEWPMKSGDRVDAVHEREDQLYLIEAKSRRSPLADLERGIYQCIKYRAVAQATDDATGRPRLVHAILLTELELPEALSELAAKHDIQLVTHLCDTKDPA